MEPVILRGEPPKAAAGSGDGSGSGYGSGYGYGSGDGYGDGYGDGSGYGSGDGYGDGSGSGSGYGYGSKEYWCSTIPYFASRWPEEQRTRYEAAKAGGLTIAFWRSTQAGGPANGGRKIEPAAPGVIHTAPGPLALCQAGTLHATYLPPKWEGDRWWIVAMHGEVLDDGDNKIGALKREILGEAI
jgi:hypothetical protein